MSLSWRGRILGEMLLQTLTVSGSGGDLYSIDPFHRLHLDLRVVSDTEDNFTHPTRVVEG